MRAAVIALALVTLTISAAVPAHAQGAGGRRRGSSTAA